MLINNPYGGMLINNSTLAGFGSLELSATEEDPVCSYSSSSGTALRVVGTLTLSGAITLDLNQGSSQCSALSISESCKLIVGDGGALDVQNSLYLAGTLDVGPGSVYTHGFLSFPASGMLRLEWGSFINDAPWFDMRGTVNLFGGLDIANSSFEIKNNNVNLEAHPTRIFSNATLTFGRGFTAIPDAVYHPISGSLILNGSSGSTLYVAGDNYLPNLEIRKQNDARVALGNNAAVHGYVWIYDGVLDLNGLALDLLGDMMVDSELSIPAASTLRITSGNQLCIRDGGVLRASGSAAQYAAICRYGTTGNYSFNALLGSMISADYCSFENMNQNGIYLQSGASVDPVTAFSNCRFSNGAAGGYLLRVDTAQSFTVNGAVFPPNTWGGAGNVKKSLNSGNLTFIAYSGSFSGSSYESDPYNRINWQLAGIMPVLNLCIMAQSGLNPIRLSWEYPYPYTSFKIYAANTPDGTFSLVGTSTTPSWSCPVNSGKRFYQVTAIQ